MTAFNDIVAAAASEEARAKAFAARVAAFLPASVPARIEVAAAKGSRVRAFVMPLVVLAVVVGAYRLGGSEGREAYAQEHAAFESYKKDEADTLARERQRQIDAAALIASASKKTQDAADARAAALQSRIDSYVEELQHRPADARCTLSDADVRRLRDDAPRAHRRPARAAPAAD